MAARSTVLNVTNSTTHTLRLVESSLSHGEWTTQPPLTIAPISSVSWESASSGFAAGTEGAVTYGVSDDQGDLGSVAPPFNLYIRWDNPFVGSNSYDETAPAVFTLTRSGGGGDNATVDYTFDWLITNAGLANGGVTAHYAVQYAKVLSVADGRDRANDFLRVCERDFTLMAGWFAGVDLIIPTPMAVTIVPGARARATWGPPVRLVPADGSPLDLVRYLVVSEVTEMFMKSQAKGWFGTANERSAGEGLSRFLGAQFLIANGLGVSEPGFALANSWMNSPRADFVNNVSGDNGIAAATGCSILFITYLNVQLGFGVNQIVAAAAPTLAGVYKTLTGDSRDPFPAFRKLLDDKFPGTTTIPGSNPDNPFPLSDNAFWAELDNNPDSVAILADGADLYQRHKTGKIWKYTGVPLTGWLELDNNPATIQIAASGGQLYQLHNTGRIWRYTGVPLTGWQELDNNPAAVAIVADGGNLYQLHKTGRIWRLTGTPLTGWQKLDHNAATVAIAAGGNALYQLHKTGKIWRFTGTPLTGWQELDDNPDTVAIAASGSQLYQRHKTGKIWKYTGVPMIGWEQLDNNPDTVAIAPADGDVYQLHRTGRIWRFTGIPPTGWRELDDNPAAAAIVAAPGDRLYQLHHTGKIWTYTGPSGVPVG